MKSAASLFECHANDKTPANAARRIRTGRAATATSRIGRIRPPLRLTRIDQARSIDSDTPRVAECTKVDIASSRVSRLLIA